MKCRPSGVAQASCPDPGGKVITVAQLPLIAVFQSAKAAVIRMKANKIPGTTCPFDNVLRRPVARGPDE